VCGFLLCRDGLEFMGFGGGIAIYRADATLQFSPIFTFI
jgi:hypothetical protein